MVKASVGERALYPSSWDKELVFEQEMNVITSCVWPREAAVTAFNYTLYTFNYTHLQGSGHMLKLSEPAADPTAHLFLAGNFG